MGVQKSSPTGSRSGQQRSFDCNLIFSVLCIMTSTTLFLLLSFLPPSDRVCIAQSVVYRRAIMAINYEWVNFGDYFHPSSVYRHASPERDSAWEQLMSHDVISVSDSELSVLHQSKDGQWKKLADGGNAAILGVHHQMNCLNLLRYYSHLELEDSTHSLLRGDVDQCIELLRHQLMCAGEVTPFLELKASTLAGSMPDLRTKHKCRRYNDLKTWARKNSKGSFYTKWDPARPGL